MSVDPLAGFAAANPNLMRGDAPPPAPPPTPRPPVQVDPGFDFNARYNENLAGLGADPRVAQMEALQAQIAGRSGPDWRPAAQLQFALGMMGGRTVGEGIRAGMQGAAPYMQAGALEASRQEGQALRDQLSSLERMSASESRRRSEAREMTQDQRSADVQDRAFEQGKKEFNALLNVEDRKLVRDRNKEIEKQQRWAAGELTDINIQAMKIAESASGDEPLEGMGAEVKDEYSKRLMENYFKFQGLLIGLSNDSEERAAF